MNPGHDNCIFRTRLTVSIAFLLIWLQGVSQERKQGDWANLQRYQKENAMLEKLSSSPKRVVFMGNSITEFWKTADSSFFIQNNYVDRGISGQTTPQMLARFNQDVIALKPAAVVILAGINDIAENTGPITVDAIFQNIISMVKLARENKIAVVMCAVLPANNFPWNPRIHPKEKIKALNQKLRSYSVENNIPFADYFTAMVDEKGGIDSRYADDGVHPNLRGYQLMEPIVQAAIRQAVR